MSEAIWFLHSLPFAQQQGIADTYSDFLSNPDGQSSGTASHFGVNCKCKAQTAYCIVKIITENAQQKRTKNKDCRELKTFSLY